MAENKTKEKSVKRNLLLTAIALIVIFITSAVLIIISLNAQKRTGENNLKLSADEVVNGVTKKMNYTNLSSISKENIQRYYEIPQNTVTDYAMYVSGHSGTETEIACFVLEDSEHQSDLEEAIHDYLNEKTSNPQVSAQQVNSNVAVHFPYVLVVVAQDSESAVKAFETVLNDSLKQES